mgnify:FL=1
MSKEERGGMRTIDHRTAANTTYDLVIVGSGVSGSIIANELAKQQKNIRVLILEAGPGDALSIAGYDNYLSRFYSAVEKESNSPYAVNPNAPMPRGNEVHPLLPGKPNTDGYMVQNGPVVTDTSFARVLGGTTMHWEAKTPRMLPEDFKMRSLYCKGLDWPLAYEDLMPYYRKAENEIGVSANIEDQQIGGIQYEPDYVFPMYKMPASYLDQVVAKGVDGTQVTLEGETYELTVRSFPQGRNGIPNPNYTYNGQKGYVPVGAVSEHQSETGERCQGNTNCTPICPVQAKYDARKTLANALRSGQVDLLPQTVASKINIDPDNGRVTSIEFKTYADQNSSSFETGTVQGNIFILAANAIENARLMLASGLNSKSGLVGRHLMDHPYLLTWALLPEIAGTMRGTICTSGISDLRAGSFRSKQAAFAVDIHNDGWGWATGSPYSIVEDVVDNKNKFGKELRQELVSRISRQLLFAFMVEMMPDPNNRVTVDPGYTDQLGNMRPILSFNVPEYSLEGIAYARQLSRKLFRRLGAEDYTSYDPLDFGYVTHNGEG